MWNDGILRSQDGDMRQIPERHVWTSNACITKSGVARRRYYNMVSGVWNWDEDMIPITLDDESGRLGIRIGSHWISTERAIALAWILRSEHSKNEVILNGHIHADNIEWEEIDDGRCILKDGCRERWKPLSWRCGAVRCNNSEYKISTQGRLMNKEGEITEGFYVDFGDGDGRRFAGTEEGLVDITTAAKLRDNVVNIPPRLMTAANCLQTGNGAQQLAAASKIDISTAWSYITSACEYLPATDLKKIVPSLISRDLWSVLNGMKGREEESLGGPLLILMDSLTRQLPKHSEFRQSSFMFPELRVGRLCIAAEN